MHVRPLPLGLPNSYSSLKGQHTGHFLREASLTPPMRSVPRYTVTACATSAARHLGTVEWWVSPTRAGVGSVLSAAVSPAASTLPGTHRRSLAAWGRYEWSANRTETTLETCLFPTPAWFNHTAVMGPCSSGCGKYLDLEELSCLFLFGLCGSGDTQTKAVGLGTSLR